MRDGKHTIYFYECEECKEELSDMSPRIIFNDKVYCGDCAFKLGLITEEEYIKHFCFSIDLPNLRATVRDGEIYLTTTKFPWERISRRRNCLEYDKWRKEVYERDNYTCQKCGIRGWKLNAHHIKSYKDYPDLRHDVDNGITLCEKCHKLIHRQMKMRGNDGEFHTDKQGFIST